jgi:predicted phosphodiesterase
MRRLAVSLRKGARPFTRVRLRRLGSACGLVVVSMAGVVLGVLLAGRVTDDIGPFRATYTVQPSLRGGTEVNIPPLGSLHLNSHAGPAHLQVRLDALDQGRTKAIVANPAALEQASDGAVDDVTRGVRRLVWRSSAAAVLGALMLGALIYRDPRRIAGCGAVAVLVLIGTGVAAASTFRADSIQEPRYEGLLTNAPAVVGDARRIADQYAEYREQLQRMVANVGRIYGTVSQLPVYSADSGTTRVLHVSDLHLNPSAWSVISTVVEQFDIDLVIDTGDIIDWGSQAESSYVSPIASLRVPYIYIRGNHDSATTAAAVARQPNATVLDNSVTQVAGLTIAGIGDPRFTPDKSADSTDTASVVGSGESLASTIRKYGKPVDLAMVHDPLAAGPLAATCPVVLAGHKHKREVSRLGPPDDVPPQGRTLLMTEGSTGGAGLRGLENEEPTPLELSVLYFGPEHTLQAYDDITVGGTGQSEVSLQRNIVRPDEALKSSPSPRVGSSVPADGSPAAPRSS